MYVRERVCVFLCVLVRSDFGSSHVRYMACSLGAANTSSVYGHVDDGGGGSDSSRDDIVRVVRMGKGHKDGKGKGARSRSPRRGMDGQSGMDGKDGMDGKGGKRGKSGVSGCKGGKTPLVTVAQAGIALDQEQVVSAQEARDILVAVQACTLASDRVGEATRVLAESVKAVDAEQARWLANFESVRRMVEARRARRQQLSESMLHLLESESD